MKNVIYRKYVNDILGLSSYFPVVGIIGARQVGKTTIGKMLKEKLEKEILYIDLELDSDLSKLNEAELFFKQNSQKCIFIDEIQLRPDLFPLIRALVDKTNDSCQFIITGSASPKLLRQSSESLAGRISYIKINPFSLDELSSETDLTNHWFRGGFPKSILAPNDILSREWLSSFVDTYIQRDLSMLGLNADNELIRRFWKMIAHMNGDIVNYSNLSKSLGISVNTVKKYISFFKNAFLVQLIEPYSSNLKKRLLKSPKIILNDTGILHYLLEIDSINHLYSNPALGNSWEAYCINQIIFKFKNEFEFTYFRTVDGAECDLVLSKSGVNKFAIEIKHSLSPKLSKGNTNSYNYIQAENNIVIIPEGNEYNLRKDVKAIGIKEFIYKY
jgi:predicted AAA+ superfamily ATPase